MRYKVITGSIAHETNTFSTVYSDLEKFRDYGLYEGEQVFQVLKGTKTIGGGFIDVARERGFDLIGTRWNTPFAWGTVTDDALNYLLTGVLEGIEAADQVDGVLLQLHGAMVSESEDDVEGYVLQEVRKKVGKDIPIIGTLDLHGNLDPRMVEQADILVGYDTYPHVDTYERGLEAAELMDQMLKGEIKPTAACEIPPMMPSPQKQKTNYYPAKEIIDLAHKIEEDDRVLNVTVLFGFPFADIPHAGMGLIVTTNDDLALAQEKAKQIADHAWRIRKSFLADVIPVKEAVREAIAAEEGPIVLVDYADNPGGGGPNDGTVILQELLRQKAKNVVVCSLNDPGAVAKAAEAGVGNTVTMKLGGKTDDRHGEPLEVTAYVKLIADGKFFRTGPMRTGTYTNLGPTAVLVVDDIEIITTTIRQQPTDLNHYRAFGVEPTLKKIIMVKSAVHFRAVHEPIAKKIIEVDAPGIHGTRFRALNYQKLRRPIFPLDPEMLGISELSTSLTADE